MRRREFITLIGGAATAWPFAARAQRAGKVPTIGFMGISASGFNSWSAAFAERLQELGWIEGRSVAIEYRWSEGRPEHVAEIATEFVQQKVDLIVAYGAAVTTLKQATASIPIVFAIAVDPVGVGLVANLSHPGGNVTGLSVQATDAAGKRLELLREVVPKLGRLGILFDAGYAAAVQEKGEVQALARSVGLEVVPQEIRRAEDIASAFDALKGQVDALYVTENALILTNGKTISTLALNVQLPTTCTNANIARAGALMSYGPNFPALFRRAAEIVDKILRGTKPGDIPVEQPTKFDLVINLKTANALGLTIPHNLLVLADDVIE
ncbi:MAG: ABC transporter substrate-binding protein [Beijerinckiaceae bacterium]|jgi:putative ABC transport system substrate-binding protein